MNNHPHIIGSGSISGSVADAKASLGDTSPQSQLDGLVEFIGHIERRAFSLDNLIDQAESSAFGNEQPSAEAMAIPAAKMELIYRRLGTIEGAIGRAESLINRFF